MTNPKQLQITVCDPDQRSCCSSDFYSKLEVAIASYDDPNVALTFERDRHCQGACNFGPIIKVEDFLLGVKVFYGSDFFFDVHPFLGVRKTVHPLGEDPLKTIILGQLPRFDKLVNQYWDQIVVDYTDYEPINDTDRDAACIGLLVPLALLRGYQRLNNASARTLPDGGQFWRDTNLCLRLRDSPKRVNREHEPLADMLDSLGGDVCFGYQRLGKSLMIRLNIYEDVPLVYQD